MARAACHVSFHRARYNGILVAAHQRRASLGLHRQSERRCHHGLPLPLRELSRSASRDHPQRGGRTNPRPPQHRGRSRTNPHQNHRLDVGASRFRRKPHLRPKRLGTGVRIARSSCRVGCRRRLDAPYETGAATNRFARETSSASVVSRDRGDSRYRCSTFGNCWRRSDSANVASKMFPPDCRENLCREMQTHLTFISHRQIGNPFGFLRVTPRGCDSDWSIN